MEKTIMFCDFPPKRITVTDYPKGRVNNIFKYNFRNIN